MNAQHTPGPLTVITSTEADANLYAASPKLLQHCQRLLNLLEGRNGEITQTPEAIAELRTDVAKATGGKS